jgi:hypothetical protein
MYHILVNQRCCCDYCGLPKQFFDLYPHCASETKESQNTDNQQANTAIALAERYRLLFSSSSVIGKVMDGFLVWLQEQQQ